MFKGLRERLADWKEKADAEVAPAKIGDSGRKIKEEKLEEILYDLEMALLESDVAFPVAKEVVDRLADDLKGKRVAQGGRHRIGEGRPARRDHARPERPAHRLL